MPTKQETLNHVRAFMKKQARQCLDPVTEACKLRGPRDPKTHRPTKCAIGCLLPDSLYSSDFEGQAFQYNVPLQSIMADLGYDLELLTDLQLAHDRTVPVRGPAFIEELEGELLSVAVKHNLNF